MYIEESNEVAEVTIWSHWGRCGIAITLAGCEPHETETNGDLLTAIEGAENILRDGIRRRWPEELIDLMRHAIDRAEAVA